MGVLGPAKNTWGCRKAGDADVEYKGGSESILQEEHVSLSCSSLRYNQAGVVAAKAFKAIVFLSCSGTL